MFTTVRAASAARPAPQHLYIREDQQVAYPEIDGIPVLLWPEHMTKTSGAAEVDVSVAPYAEAYGDQEFYDTFGTDSAADELSLAATRDGPKASDPELQRIVDAIANGTVTPFPGDHGEWVVHARASAAHDTANRFLAPIEGAVVCQIGGIGRELSALLLGGAGHGVLVTPFVGEAQAARARAENLGITDRMTIVCALGEEMPFADESFDRVFAGSTVHHTYTELSAPEIWRILKPGGKFTSIDVWESAAYSLGIKMFGKHSVACKALNADRIAPFSATFGAGFTSNFHGAIARYPLTAFERVTGRRLNAQRALRVGRWEDRTAKRVPGAERLSSLISLQCVKLR